MRVSRIAEIIGARVEGDDQVEITGIAKIEEAMPGEITFLSNQKYEKYVATTRASAIIVADDFKTDRKNIALVRVKDPYVGFVFALRTLLPPAELLPAGIHPLAYISPGARLGNDLRVGPFVSIMDGAAVGDRSVIMNGSVIGRGAAE